MSGWELRSDFAGGSVELTGGGRNVTGTPLVSATFKDIHTNGANTPVAGVYRFTMETTSTVSVRIVHNYDTGNPLVFGGTRSVTADGSTENLNLLPGWAIVLAGDLQAGDEFEMGVGCHYDSGNETWIRRLTLGPAAPGHPRAEVVLQARNAGGGTFINSKVVATNAARIENAQAPDRPIYCFRQTGTLNPAAHADPDGEEITFADYASGSPPTVDILVGGQAPDVYDVTNGVIITGGQGLKCDGSTVYRWADGTAYQSCEFVLSPDLRQSDTTRIYVSDGGESVQLATADGDWVSGPTGIDLTEPGRVPGTVTAGATVEFRMRASVPDGETGALNLRSFSLRLVGDGV